MVADTGNFPRPQATTRKQTSGASASRPLSWQQVLHPMPPMIHSRRVCALGCLERYTTLSLFVTICHALLAYVNLVMLIR